MRLALCLGWALAALFAAPGFAGISVVVSPGTASVSANGSHQFSAQVFGSTDQTVRWEVNGVPGGAPSTGVISDAGLYTAPPDAAKALSVTVEAEPEAAPAASGAANVAVAKGPAPGTAYWVATTGQDSNPGTESKPFLSLQHAIDIVPKGSEVLVESGVYNEQVTITRSGSASAGFLVLTAAPSAHPIIDGTGLAGHDGADGLVTISEASWVRVEGFEIRNYFSKKAARSPYGIHVRGAGDHIEILSNDIHAIGSTLKASARRAGSGGGIYVSRLRKGPIDWLTIDGNTLHDLDMAGDQAVSLEGNLEFWQVENNSIDGVDGDGIFVLDVCCYAHSPHGLIAHNVINDVNGAALLIDGSTLITVQANLVHDNEYGFLFSSYEPTETTSWVWAHDNILYHNKRAGITIGVFPFRIQIGATQNCFIFNNTLYENDSTMSGSGEFVAEANQTGNVFADNILFANAQGLLVDNPYPPVTTLDHNLYFSAGGAAGAQWSGYSGTYASLGAFQSASGQDANSRVADPAFAAVATDNFVIPSTSPAVTLGEIVSLSNNGLLNYSGNPRTLSATIDAGALQH